MGILGIRIWSTDIALEFHTYCTRCREQSGLCVIAVLLDLFAKLDLSQYDNLHIFADCGPHFRWGTVLKWLPHDKLDVFKEVSVTFFLEGHGKGAVDGNFGLIRKWIELECVTCVCVCMYARVCVCVSVCGGRSKDAVLGETSDGKIKDGQHKKRKRLERLILLFAGQVGVDVLLFSSNIENTCKNKKGFPSSSLSVRNLHLPKYVMTRFQFGEH